MEIVPADKSTPHKTQFSISNIHKVSAYKKKQEPKSQTDRHSYNGI